MEGAGGVLPELSSINVRAFGFEYSSTDMLGEIVVPQRECTNGGHILLDGQGVKAGSGGTGAAEVVLVQGREAIVGSVGDKLAESA